VSAPRLTLAAINALDRAAFVDRLGALFEGPPWIVEAAWAARPFTSVAALYRALCDAIDGATVARQIALIQAHPDLVGRAARAGALTPESTGEQRAAGLGDLTPDEVAAFDRLNRDYRERFGFPFVICARENKKASILAGFRDRLGNDREREIATALGEVAKIGRLRLLDLVELGGEMPDDLRPPEMASKEGP
jgi:OHCU decarboxylase